jgi:hypothetical protein
MPTWTGATNNNWGTASNWTNPIAIPTAGTNAIFTDLTSSVNCTITPGATCLSLICTGYTGQINVANTLNVASNITLGAGMALTGSLIQKNAGPGTLTPNGVRIPALVLNTGATQSFNDNCTFGSIAAFGSVRISGGGFTASVENDLNFQGGVTTITPTLFRRIGTGSGLAQGNYTTSGSATCSIEINNSGVTSFFGPTGLTLNGVKFTYITGSIDSLSGVVIGAGTTIFNNVSSLLFNRITFGASAGQILQLNSNTYVSGALTAGAGSGTINGSTLYVGGNIATNTAGFLGTSTIEMSGSSNASITTTGVGVIQNNLIINKSGGATVTLPTAGTITWGLAGRTLTYTAGTVNVSTSTIQPPINTNVTMSGMPFYNLTLPGAATYSISLPISTSNNLTLGATGNTFFTGSSGWTCANLICTTVGRVITLANSSSGASYRTTTNTQLTGTAASPITITSNNATTRSLWTLNNGANQSLAYVSGTRIDSSQGQTIYTFASQNALTNTVNWATGSRPGTVAYTFVN